MLGLPMPHCLRSRSLNTACHLYSLLLSLWVSHACDTCALLQRGVPVSGHHVARAMKERPMKARRFILLLLIGTLVLWSVTGWAQQPKPGGTLRLAMPGDMTFFN